MKKLSLLLSILCINTAAYCQNYTEEWYPETSATTCTNSDYDYGVYDSYRYFSVGVGPIVFIPNLGVGYRERHAQLGWDSNISVSSFGYIHQLSANVVGHYYLNPHQQDSYYVGLGLLGSGIFTNKGESFGTLSTDFVFGKEFEKTDYRGHFIEMHVGIPTFVFKGRRSGCSYFPLMYIKYGVSF